MALALCYTSEKLIELCSIQCSKAEMMQTAADVADHDIWQFQAIIDGNRYFAFVKLNVNWQSPCILYEYDVVTDDFTELCRWNGVELVGISI